MTLGSAGSPVPALARNATRLSGVVVREAHALKGQRGCRLASVPCPRLIPSEHEQGHKVYSL